MRCGLLSATARTGWSRLFRCSFGTFLSHLLFTYNIASIADSNFPVKQAYNHRSTVWLKSICIFHLKFPTRAGPKDVSFGILIILIPRASPGSKNNKKAGFEPLKGKRTTGSLWDQMPDILLQADIRPCLTRNYPW